MLRFLRYDVPPLVWASLIVMGSGDTLSAPHTGHFLALFLPEQYLDVVNVIVRKLAHLTVFGMLAGFTFRAAREDEARPWRRRWAAIALAFTVIVASVDEWQQSFVPSRTGTVNDVFIDSVGAGTLLLALRTLAGGS